MAMLAVGMVNEGAAENRWHSHVTLQFAEGEKCNANAGAWFEGTDYGIFHQMGTSVRRCRRMETALGSTFGLSKVAGLSMRRDASRCTIASNTRQRFTFSDVGTGSEAAMGWANWWARRFNALETFDYSRQIGNSPLNALTLAGDDDFTRERGLESRHAFRGPADSIGRLFQEVVTLRENWTDTKATFVGGMGGTYTSHGMLQSGTFQLSARGVKWFVGFEQRELRCAESQ